MSYDPRCFELAEYFLVDEPRELQEKASELAQAIQDAVEDWMTMNEEWRRGTPPETA